MLFDGLLIEHQCRPQAVAAAGTSGTIVYRNLFLSSLLGRPIQCLSLLIRLASAQRSDGRSFPTYFSLRLDDRLAASFFARASSVDWMVCALTIARISPGKRSSISAQREVLCISTPRRSACISPVSLSALKRWERVDYGIALSLSVR